MHYLKHFYYKILKYDSINKFSQINSTRLPRLKKIILNFSCKKTDLKQLASSLLALEIISNQFGVLTITKKSNILLKIREGQPVGCKVTLQNKNLFNFFEKTIMKIFPTLKTFTEFKCSAKLKKSAFSYQIHEIFSFFELENHYHLFSSLPKLDIVLVTSAKTKKELVFLLRSFQFPFKNEL